MRSRPSRRTFLAAAAVPAVAQSSRLTIDCQSHLFVPELIALMERRKTSPYVYRRDGGTFIVVNDWVRRLMPKHTDVNAKLADMDAAGIQMTALSINDPGPELFGSEGPAIARLLHDHLAEIARKHALRFFALMTLPLQDVPAALKEAERCVKLGMKGILLYSNINGEFPDEPKYRPLFEYAQDAGLPVLLHPAYPTTYQQTKGYEMAAGLGLMFDTTIALARLILSGLLDEYPKLKLVCPHVGGALPYLVGRIDHQTMVLKRGADKIRRAPSEYLKQVWFDTVSPIAMAIRYGINFAGPDKMLYSSDHPWVEPKLILSLVRSLNLSPETEAKMLGGNAKALFNL
ncbi:MAG TPA: amidohydrolase family protein [Bryobacteraceae bacterium]|nr:amidohydrolase family protein [Bryobacteraceae bacterium]